MLYKGKMIKSEIISTTKELSVHRMEALFDGALAIVMTLMLFDLKLPEDAIITNSSALLGYLADMHVTFIKYLTSFFILASIWVSNNVEYHYVKKTDTKHLWLSLTGLFFIVLIPFTTSLQDDFSGILLADILFHIDMFLIQFFLYLRWLHLYNNTNLTDETRADKKLIQGHLNVVKLKMLIPLAAVFLTLISHDYANFIYFLFIFIRLRRRAVN